MGRLEGLLGQCAPLIVDSSVSISQDKMAKTTIYGTLSKIALVNWTWSLLARSLSNQISESVYVEHEFLVVFPIWDCTYIGKEDDPWAAKVQLISKPMKWILPSTHIMWGENGSSVAACSKYIHVRIDECTRVHSVTSKDPSVFSGLIHNIPTIESSIVPGFSKWTSRDSPQEQEIPQKDRGSSHQKLNRRTKQLLKTLAEQGI